MKMILFMLISVVITQIATQAIHEGISPIQYNQDMMKLGQIIDSIRHYQEKLTIKLSEQDSILFSQNMTLHRLIEKLGELQIGSTSETIKMQSGDVMKKIDNMTTEIEKISKERKKDHEHTTKEIQTLTRNIVNMTKEIKEGHKKQMQDIQIMFSNQDSLISSQNKTLHGLQEKLIGFENGSRLSDKSCTLPSPSQNETAFYVISTSDHNSGIVVFDQVITNIGSKYDKSTGIFNVASNGVYVFSWSVETISQLTKTTLEVNGVGKGTVAADERSGSKHDTSTSFAVLELKVGDKVNVRVNSGRAVSGGTAFSGWRLKDQKSAFYASMSRKDSSNPFKFDKVYTNNNLVYSTSTGKFRVVAQGLCVLTTSLSAYSGSMADSYIYIKNGSTPVKSYPITLNSFTGRHDTTATMMLAYLNTGEEVYVGKNSAAATSMFAGWLAAPGTPYSYPAFTASLISDSSSTPLIFGKSHLSPHNGYSRSTGKFVADRSGVYVFFWNIRADRGLVKSVLRVNARDLGGTRSEGRSTSDYDDSSSVAVVQLSPGDQVYVRIITGPADEGQSVFCGWLLYAK